jgi:hypothetical protein
MPGLTRWVRPKLDRWRSQSVTCEKQTPKLNTGIDRSAVHPGLRPDGSATRWTGCGAIRSLLCFGMAERSDHPEPVAVYDEPRPFRTARLRNKMVAIVRCGWELGINPVQVGAKRGPTRSLEGVEMQWKTAGRTPWGRVENERQRRAQGAETARCCPLCGHDHAKRGTAF